MNYFFRNIKEQELTTAYELHCKLVKHMLQKGIRQWLTPIKKQKIIERQSKNENFGLFDEKNEIKVFLSLISRSDYNEWNDYITDANSIWLSTLSINIFNSEKGLGKIAVQHAIDYLKNNSVKKLYLDCVINDGFLVNYYERLGFIKIAETIATYKSGIFHLALMKKDIK